MKSLVLLTLLSSLSLASAQEYKPSPEAIKSVDAQAFAYTGKHCSSKFKARAPRQMPQGDFAILISITEKVMREVARQDPSVKLKTTKVSATLYIGAAESFEKGIPRSEFLVFFYDQGMAYAYSCDLK
jgi:hypothetical protein